LNNIIQGPALEKLKELDSESVDCCITSPPYWALRDYKTEGQLGLEPTFQEYITKLIEIFNQVKRVLKKTGSCWVNIGDTYSGSGTRGGQGYEDSKDITERRYYKAPKEIPEKSLCLIPQRFAIAMVDAGWICRNTIIWYKPNCMPSSAKDRFTVDFEYLFFFTRSQKYYFDTQYEGLTELTKDRMTRQYSQVKKYHVGLDKRTDWPESMKTLGRLKRCVWKIPTQPFSEAHFAVFPPQLVETPLKACCPEFICKKCGKPREKIIESKPLHRYELPQDHPQYRPREFYARTKIDDNCTMINNDNNAVFSATIKATGLTDCDCNAGFDGGIVLDPFIGSGTVGLVAMQNARNFIGIELSQAYIEMAIKRLQPYLLQTRLL
jgi:DNA modification methylase